MIRNETQRYTVFGGIFGLLFPVTAIILEVALIQGNRLNLENVLLAHEINPLLWIIDTAPFIIGAIALLAGKRQDVNASQNESLNQLLKSKTALSKELEFAATELEKTVESRTQELEKRNRYLEAAAMVTQDASSILDPDLLLERAVTLIGENFGFNHVGIFLVDENHQWAILRASSSEGGKQMIARDHRLQVGKQGIVGYVTGIGKARISQDIELDRIHSVTPELPNTRSEMALPLKAHNQIIGALDIQDVYENAFSSEDVSALQTLANQIAVAIDNARLYQQAQLNIQEIQTLMGETDLQTWNDAYAIGTIPAYKFEASQASGVQKVTDTETSTQDSGKIKIPINVRGQTIGSIDILREENNEELSEDEARVLETLSEQLGVAIDSARLFQETQTRASTERIIGEVSSKIRETLDINSILKTTAIQVREMMNLPEVTIRITEPSKKKANNGDSSNEVNPV